MSAMCHRAAGPRTNTSYRSVGMACSRWSRIFVKNLTMFEVSGTAHGAHLATDMGVVVGNLWAGRETALTLSGGVREVPGHLDQANLVV